MEKKRLWMEHTDPSETVKQAAEDFLDRLEELEVPVHSMLLVHKNQLEAEIYYEPFHRERLHRMFSVTKNLVSLGIGILAEDKKISLDDPIIDYFPELVPENPHPYLREMTIRHILKMETCHKATTYKEDMSRDWVESFFKKEPDHKPGCIFCYDTSGTHTLCALAERLTGQKLLDFLRDRCLSEIGFSKEAYLVEDPFGFSMGGSGLMAKPSDLARFGLLVMNGGQWQGRQLLPRQYLKEAVSFQVPNRIRGSVLEECQGYGYQFWRGRNQGYHCYGMGGQLIICMPEQDLLCVTTANTKGVAGGHQLIYQAFYDTVLKAAMTDDDGRDARPWKSRRLMSVSGISDDETQKKMSDLNGRWYQTDGKNPAMKMVCFEFDQRNGTGAFIYRGDNAENILRFGIGKNLETTFPQYEELCSASAAWLDERTFYLKAELLGEHLGSFFLQAVFEENSLTLYMDQTVEFGLSEFSGFINAAHIAGKPEPPHDGCWYQIC